MNKNEIQKLLFLKHCNSKDPFLITNYDDLMNLFKSLKEDEITKFCYINKKWIENILYIEEMLINISFEHYIFSNYFYLALLVEGNRNIMDYSYKSDVINLIINENNNKNDNNKLIKLINEKII